MAKNNIHGIPDIINKQLFFVVTQTEPDIWSGQSCLACKPAGTGIMESVHASYHDINSLAHP